MPYVCIKCMCSIHASSHAYAQVRDVCAHARTYVCICWRDGWRWGRVGESRKENRTKADRGREGGGVECMYVCMLGGRDGEGGEHVFMCE